MTIVEAFVLLQPYGDDTQRNSCLDEAADVVLRALTSFGRTRHCDESHVEDARQNVLATLVRTGPRVDETGAMLPDVPNTEAEARAFLYASLRNACRSLRRRTRRLEPTDPHDLDPVSQGLPDYGATEAAYAASEDRVRRVYAAQLTPVLADAIGELVRIAAGEVGVDDLIARDASSSTGDGGRDAPNGVEQRKTLRDRRYKRYERALASLRRQVDADRTLDEDGRKLHHRVIDDLKIRGGDR